MHPIILIQFIAVMGLVLLALSTGVRLLYALLGVLLILYASYMVYVALHDGQLAPTHHQPIQTAQRGV